MANNKLLTAIISIVAVILFILIAALSIGSILNIPYFDSENITSSTNQTILTSSTDTLSPIGFDITYYNSQVYNNTWLDFNGINGSVVSPRYDTISFWYKNSTVDWTFVVNSSGTLYLNGILGTPDIYPVYDNGTNMFLGKTGASTFFDGSIDDFRGYASSIDAELVNLTYFGGRL